MRTLHRELGVAPLESTTELYHAIRDGRVAADARGHGPCSSRSSRSRSSGASASGRRWPRPTASVGPDGRLVVLEGELGIGKTRLADELLAWARAEGAVAVGVRAFEHERDLAYGTLIELLRGALRDGDAARVAGEPRAPRRRGSSRRSGRRRPSRSTGPGAQARFFDGLAGGARRGDARARRRRSC